MGKTKEDKPSPKRLIPAPSTLEEPYDWTVTFADSTLTAAPISCFKHVPLSDWEDISEDGKTKVEVRNNYVTTGECYRSPYWYASIIRVCGYKLLLRFEGFGRLSYLDFWVNICTADIHPIGWCDVNGKQLIPPNCPNNMNPPNLGSWIDSVKVDMIGAQTIPSSLPTEIEAVTVSSKYKVGDLVEALDWDRMSRLKVATVKLVLGKRLHLVYFDAKTEAKGDAGLWCHEDSSLIHPCGWAATVGHEIVAPANYNPEILPSSHFQFTRPYSHIHLKEGMKLELINPLDLSEISAGTIQKVLKYGYMMVRADCVEDKTPGLDWICLHITSEDIFFCGFSKLHDITLTPPVGYDESTFDWNDYCTETETVQAPIGNLNQSVVKHNLKVGMKVEATDLWEPWMICVATIVRITGNLIRVHFDGWSKYFEQWMSASSPDIYPVGYCELVGHRLEKPPQPKKKKPFSPKSRRKQKRQHLTNRSGAPEPKKDTLWKPRNIDPTRAISWKSSVSSSRTKEVELGRSVMTDESETSHCPSGRMKKSDSRVSSSGSMTSSPSFVDHEEDPLSGNDFGVNASSGDSSFSLTVTKPANAQKNSPWWLRSSPSAVGKLSVEEFELPSWFSPVSPAKKAKLWTPPSIDTTHSTRGNSWKSSVSSSRTKEVNFRRSLMMDDSDTSPSPAGRMKNSDSRDSCSGSMTTSLAHHEEPLPDQDYGVNTSSGDPSFSMAVAILDNAQKNSPSWLKPSPSADGKLSVETPTWFSPASPELAISWTTTQVQLFLQVNDLGEFVDNFIRNKIDGQRLLALTVDQLVVLTQMRLGPALKIIQLITDLKP